ncbi:hypothetical protein PC122_g24667, partial [Phytophthora cactorum]
EKDGGGSYVDAVDTKSASRVFAVRATCEWSKLAEIFHEFHVVFGLCSGTSGLDCCELPSVVGRFLGVAELGSLGF